MLRELGSTLSPVNTKEAMDRVRRRVEREIDEVSRARHSRKPGRGARLLIAASLALLTIGGIAVAGGFDDGAPVVTVESSVEEQIAGLVFQISESATELDAATSEAEAAAIKDGIAALDARVAELCAELPDLRCWSRARGVRHYAIDDNPSRAACAWALERCGADGAFVSSSGWHSGSRWLARSGRRRSPDLVLPRLCHVWG